MSSPLVDVGFLGAAFGNKFAGELASTFGEGDASRLDAFFSQQAVAVLVIAGIFFARVPWIKKLTGGIK